MGNTAKFTKNGFEVEVMTSLYMTMYAKLTVVMYVP